MRDRVKRRIPDLKARRQFWESLLDSSQPDRIFAAADMETESAFIDALDRFGQGELRGRVYLVGAGPGDPGLLTLRGLQVIQQADVVLYDRLVSDEVLDLVRRDAERIDVGKRPGCHPVQQAEINQLLIEHARRGLKVIRLKGGDPFIFGRGGEELQALAAAGIDFEVVPGMTAAVACGAYAGIPLTHRDLAQHVVFATAHGQHDDASLNWEALARPAQTRVFYMPVKQLGQVRDRLMQHALDGKTPVALIENGTRANQRVIRGQLAELPDLAREHAVVSPAILVVGEVAALHETLAWFQPVFAQRRQLPLAVAV
jgi:uroporphyrin-III C-methyltransferase/precorrin-2 dehydrogenase/sirohydrochlorin ferrochelatase